jgi:hypothetical protein
MAFSGNVTVIPLATEMLALIGDMFFRAVFSAFRHPFFAGPPIGTFSNLRL